MTQRNVIKPDFTEKSQKATVLILPWDSLKRELKEPLYIRYLLIKSTSQLVIGTCWKDADKSCQFLVHQHAWQFHTTGWYHQKFTSATILEEWQFSRTLWVLNKKKKHTHTPPSFLVGAVADIEIPLMVMSTWIHAGIFIVSLHGSLNTSWGKKKW